MLSPDLAPLELLFINGRCGKLEITLWPLLGLPLLTPFYLSLRYTFGHPTLDGTFIKFLGPYSYYESPFWGYPPRNRVVLYLARRRGYQLKVLCIHIAAIVS